MGIEMMHVSISSTVRAQEMSVFPSPLDVEAETRFAGFEFPPSSLWVSIRFFEMML